MLPKPYKACSCRDPQTKRLLGKACPRLQHPDHGGWYARYEGWRKPDGQRRQPRVGPFPSPEECKRALVHALEEGPTVNQVLDDYMDSLNLSATTERNYTRALRYIRDLIGNSRAQAITADDIDLVRRYLLAHGRRDGAGLSQLLVDRAICLLRAAFELAVHRRRLTRRPIPTDPENQAIAL